MKKYRIISIILSTALAVGCVTVPTINYPEQLSPQILTADAATYIEVTELPTARGRYKLMNDITLTEPWRLYELGLDNFIVLDLNGHTIDRGLGDADFYEDNGYSIDVYSSSLTLMDSNKYVNPKGEGAKDISDNMLLWHNYNGNEGSVLIVSEFDVPEKLPIRFATIVKYGFPDNEDTTFTKDWKAEMGNANPADYFYSEDPEYEVVLSNDGEAKLVVVTTTVTTTTTTAKPTTTTTTTKKTTTKKTTITTITTTTTEAVANVTTTKQIGSTQTSADGLWTYDIIGVYSKLETDEKWDFDALPFARTEKYLVVKSYKGTDTEVTVPAEIDGMKVKVLNNTFSSNEKIEKLSISEGVEEITNYCFKYCNALYPENVTFPKSLTTLGDNAFTYWLWNGTNGDTLVIPETVTNFGKYVCSYNNKLKNVTLPKEIKLRYRMECFIVAVP